MKPGIHDGIPADLYHADIGDTPTLSASVAKVLINQSPAHARECHPKLRTYEPESPDPKFDLGTAVHAYFLEGVENVCVVPYDDWRTAAAKEMRDIARADGLTPLLAKQWDEVQEMAQAVREQLDAHGAQPALFANGKPERVLVWEDSGVMCRARVDWLHDDLTTIDDLKTSRVGRDQWMRTTMYAIGADFQAAFYLRGLAAITGRTYTYRDFRFCVAEVAPPYAISVVSPGPDVMELANKKVDAALKLWRRCLETDRWPGYEPRVAYAELPPWEEARFLERELREVAA